VWLIRAGLASPLGFAGNNTELWVGGLKLDSLRFAWYAVDLSHWSENNTHKDVGVVLPGMVCDLAQWDSRLR
jgi:hypothetical protein